MGWGEFSIENNTISQITSPILCHQPVHFQPKLDIIQRSLHHITLSDSLCPGLIFQLHRWVTNTKEARAALINRKGRTEDPSSARDGSPRVLAGNISTRVTARVRNPVCLKIHRARGTVHPGSWLGTFLHE